jgi:ankyrin repeat protein
MLAAVKSGDSNAVLQLLETKGVDIDARIEGGKTALTVAAKMGHEYAAPPLTHRTFQNFQNFYFPPPALILAF